MAEKKKRKFTRRSFLKGASIAGAGIAAAGPLSKLINIGPDPAMADTEFGGGYAGKILHVDLGGGHLGNVGGTILTTTEPTYKYADRFLGARGIHEWMIFNHVPVDADAFDPENLLCLGAGPLSGTPGASRLEITTINATSGGTSHSSGGSDVHSEMKYAGYDNIIISGKASSPSYLYINDGEVELRDASHLWGKNAIEARNIVREELGDKRICAVGIGVAGENLSKMAMITGDAWHAHGGFGLGGVMGSKNLKLICVRGHGSVKVADPEKFKETIDSLWHSTGLAPYHWLETWGGGYNLHKTMQRLRNGQWLGPTWTDEETDQTNQKGMDDNGYTGKRYCCRHCPKINHGTFYKITDGPHAGVKCKWVMTCYASSWFGILDPLPGAADLLNFAFVEDSLGLDDTQTAATLSWAFECYQRGLITTEDTGGIELVWTRDSGAGNNEVIFQVVEAIAHRSGKLGELLVDGAWDACKKLGPRVDADGKTPEYYIVGTKKNVTCKDQLGRRSPKSDMGNYISLRGGKHSDGAYGPGPGRETMTPQEYADMKNGSIYAETGRFISYNNWLKEVYDSIGQCWHFRDDYSPDKIAAALNYATGSSFTGNSLVYQMGRKLFNIAKAINTIRKGFTREHDIPLDRVLEPLPLPNNPAHHDIVQWNEQLDKWYDYQGWDRETGWQKRKTLNDLDLGQVAIALWREDKLK